MVSYNLCVDSSSEISLFPIFPAAKVRLTSSCTGLYLYFLSTSVSITLYENRQTCS